MGCKLTTTKDVDRASAVHSATPASAVASSGNASAGSRVRDNGTREPLPKSTDTASPPPSDKPDDAVISLPSTSSSCTFSPYYDPLPAAGEDREPLEKVPNRTKKRKMPRSSSVDKADAASDTSSRYSMSVERQRDRAEVPDSPSSNGSFRVELGGSIRSASSSVTRSGDAVFDRSHGMAASRLVGDHPATSDPMALLLSPRQRTVSVTDPLSQSRGPGAAKKAGGPPLSTRTANGPKRRRTPVQHDDDDELVLACMDCGMEIVDDSATQICPLTGKLHT